MWSSGSQELRACALSDLVDGVMKKVQVGDKEDNFIVVASVEGKVSFTSPPLIGGMDEIPASSPNPTDETRR